MTRWGESLRVKTSSGRAVQMQWKGNGRWEAALPSTVKEYTFEVLYEGKVVRKEWRGHEIIPDGGGNRTVFTRWIDRPKDSPFYSSFFSDVVFKRHTYPVSKVSGNVCWSFLCPVVRPEETICMITSLDGWKKAHPMDDSSFPMWNIEMKVGEPFEYKFVIADRKSLAPLCWEKGGNHVMDSIPGKGESLVIEDLEPEFDTKPWKGTGVAVPVFSLRTSDSFGVGEFLDICVLADWASARGQNLIQLLPVNDTSMSGTWSDSYPYNAVSTMALHPQYISLKAAGVPVTPEYEALKSELESLDKMDYEKVNSAKEALLRKAFPTAGKKALASKACKKFMADNIEWLEPYAVFRCLTIEKGTADFRQWGSMSEYSLQKAKDYAAAHKDEVDFHYWIQFCLDTQLRKAVEYAHSLHIGLKGDLPIGISRTSVDAWVNPSLYHMDSQAGAPPDPFSDLGQNWGFPTYNWERMSRDGFAWWRRRMGKMAEYFDAFRIDHILGFFRIWEIPMNAVHGLLGYFNPALPYSKSELEALGFDVEKEAAVLLEDDFLEEVFGSLATLVKERYIIDGVLSQEVDCQKKVLALFRGEGPDQTLLREGFLTLHDEVLFIQDPRKKGYFHPRIMAQNSLRFKSLDKDLQKVFMELHEDFYYRRHNSFWRESAMVKLPALLESTKMLTCGEDLGMIPACVPSVMEELGILSLEIQRMPKAFGVEFGNTASYPHYSVCATGTHDTSNIRAWWEEDPASTQRFYNDVLGHEGDAPKEADPEICAEIIDMHTSSPSMLAVLPIQDWLSSSETLRYKGRPQDERINVPADSHNYWRYRLHLPIEKLSE